MDVAETDRLLTLGLGRAILFLRQHDSTPYRDLLLRHVLRFQGYDQQVEGLRTAYLRDAMTAAGLLDAFVAPVLAALRETDDGHDFSQLLDLTLGYAQDGNLDARAILYEVFERPDADDPFLAAEEIVKVDGLAGLLVVADRIGARLLDSNSDVEPTDWMLGYLLRVAEDRCGKEATRRALAEAAATDPRVATFAKAAQAQNMDKGERPARSYEFAGASYVQIKEALFDRSRWRGSHSFGPRRLVRWGLDASDEDIARAAADLLAEKEQGRLIGYLSIFLRRPFPLAPERFLSFLRHPTETLKDRHLVGGAAEVLSRVADQRVRDTVLALISDDAIDGWLKSFAVKMLHSNYAPGDEATLLDLWSRTTDIDDLHWLGTSVRDVFEVNLTVAAVPLLLAVYESGPCSFCRHGVVEILQTLGEAPAWLLEECLLDANPTLRQDAADWLTTYPSRGRDEASGQAT